MSNENDIVSLVLGLKMILFVCLNIILSVSWKMTLFACHIENDTVCLHVGVIGNDFVFMMIMMDGDGKD